MQQMFEYQYGQLNYLTPLLKWRIMDVKSLKEASEFPKNYYSFCRVIRNLEEKKLLLSQRDPTNRKKYVYLSSLGEQALSGDEGTILIHPETLNHDRWVSEIIQGMLVRGWILDFKLEHEIKSKGISSISHGLIPDAILKGEKQKVNFTMAFELELTRKNFPRMVEKLRQYAYGKEYDYFFYLFTNPRLMETYRQLIKEKVSDEFHEQFMLFCGDESMKLEDFYGYAVGKKTTLKELFQE